MIDRANDAAGLVERLRVEGWGENIADTLQHWCDERREAADTITRMVAREEALRATLDPFARWADTLADVPDHDVRYATLHVPTGARISITAADLRRVRDAFQPPAGEGEGL